VKGIGPAQVAARVLEFGFLRKLHPLLSARLAAAMHPAGVAVLALFGAPAAVAFGILHSPRRACRRSVIVVFALVPHREDYDVVGVLDFEQRNVARTSEWDDEGEGRCCQRTGKFAP